MKRSLAYLSLGLILLAFAASSTSFRTVSADQTVYIFVQVHDQNNYWYNGVAVEIFQLSGPFEGGGIVQNGTWTSPQVLIDSTYIVEVSNGVYSQNQTITVSVNNVFVNFVLFRPPEPVLSLGGVSFAPTPVSPGTTFNASLTISSSSNSSAYNGLLQFNSTSSPVGITVSGQGSAIPIGTVLPFASRTFTVTLSANPTIITSNYVLGYRLTYDDASGHAITSGGTVSIPVSGTPSRPNLIVSDITYSSPSISPGNEFLATVNIMNTGNENALGSSISLQPNVVLSIVGGTGTISMGTITAGQNVSVNVELYASNSAPIGPSPMKFSFLYTSDLGVLFNDSGVFTVTLTATPDLKIGSFTASNAPLTPGLSTFLTMNLINVGGDTAYDVVLTVSGVTFLNGNSSNYLGAIANGSSAKASFFLSIANSTKPGNYNLKIELNYSDLEGTGYSSHSNYSVQISPISPPDVSVTNILLDPPVLSTGTTGSITLFFKNSGSSNAQNVIVRAAGGSRLLSSNYFGLGTMASGGQVTQIVGLNVPSTLAAGNYTILFNITYSDVTGKTYSVVSPMEISILDSPSFLSLSSIAVIGVVVVVGVVCLIFLKKYNVF